MPNLRQVFLITEFKFNNPGSGKFEDQILSINTSQVVKTCGSIGEAEAFIHLPENAHRVLVALPAWEVPNSRQLHFLNHNTKYMQKIDIAKITYLLGRAADLAAGLPVSPAWDDLPDAQRQEELKQVQFYIDNPAIAPQEVHRQWLSAKAVEGWGSGPLYDPVRKQDPNFTEFDSLPQSKKFRYYFAPQVVAILKMFLPPDVKFDRDGTIGVPNKASSADTVTVGGSNPPNIITADTTKPDAIVITKTGTELLAGEKENTDPAATPQPEAHTSGQDKKDK